jgi:hypothetical protein
MTALARSETSAHTSRVLRAALIAGLAVALLAATAAGAGTARPSLEVQTTEPFRIRGEAFRSYELVRVTAEIDGVTSTLSRRAGRRGRFWAKFPEDLCSLTVEAVGARGSRASLNFAFFSCRPTR